MTEADWLTTTRLPKAMLRHARGLVSPRRLQLAACATCRLVWDHFEPVAAAAVEAAERHADGITGGAEFAAARADLLRHLYPDGLADPFPTLDDVASRSAGLAAESVVHDDVPGGALRAVDWVLATAVAVSPYGSRQATLADLRRKLCDRIREVLGNPFRTFQPVAGWLGGGFVQPDGVTVRLTDAVRGLAAGIHAEQAFDRLPLLADALEDAGATDPALLAHCRTGPDHVRGCWALDLVLGKG